MNLDYGGVIDASPKLAPGYVGSLLVGGYLCAV